MATTKFTASVFLILVHPDGTKLTKRAVARYLGEKLDAIAENDYDAGMQVAKAVVRDVDRD